MDRAERRRELLELFHERAAIARTFGMRLSFDEKDRAVITLPYNPGLDHGLGGVHGGVYATLLDSAGWFACAVARPEPCWIATSEMSVHFLRPAIRVALRAVGEVLKPGKRQDVAQMYLWDENGELVGHATGTFLALPHIPRDTGNGGTP